MEHRPLGNSGLLVSVLCLGTMVFGEENPRGTDQTSAAHIIQKFLDAGGNHIDTANVYAGGRSEEIVGAAIKDRRDRVILATKVRNATGQDLKDQGLSRCHMIQRGYSSRFAWTIGTSDVFPNKVPAGTAKSSNRTRSALDHQ